jgi:hypothetical protein
VVVDVPGATSAGRSRCPAPAQAVNREVESTGLAARLEYGSFHHLRGSMFCGARAKCALGECLGAIHSSGCGCVFVATESRVLQESVPDRPRPVSALTPAVV